MASTDVSSLFEQATRHQLAGEHDLALAVYERLFGMAPDQPEALNNAGLIHYHAGRLELALTFFRRAAAARPGYHGALRNGAVAAAAKGDADDEIAWLRQALAAKADDLDCLDRLATLLYGARRYWEAIATYKAALALAPDDAVLCGNLGAALRVAGELEQAENWLRRAIALEPGNPHFHNSLGTTLKARGSIASALAAFDEAIRLEPEYAEAYWNKATASILAGRLEEGWSILDWRWRISGFPSPVRRFDRPEWTGGDIAGRRLFVHFEQGFGDTIQFIRFVRLAKLGGATTIVECQQPLVPLLKGLSWIDELVADGDPLPQFDTYIAMMSLPRVLNVGLKDLPGEVPYVVPPPDRLAAWERRLAGEGGLKVGLVWAGRPSHHNDHLRSLDLAMLAPLADVPGVRFYSLQKGPAAARLSAGRLRPVDLGSDCADFADTACAIQALDLVITVDTSVAHLAGALGRPAWVLLPYAPDWRWMLDREDSPWYPTLRLVRQSEGERWQSVIARVAEALSGASTSRRNG